MKNKIALIMFMTIIGLSATAQTKKGNDFILFNNNWNMDRVQPFSYNPYFPFMHTDLNNHQFSLQYVRSMNRVKALRFSLSYQNYQFDGTSTYNQIGDTSIQTYQYLTSNTPKVGVGLEWRKMLHKDVMLIGGADMQLGIGTLNKSEAEFKSVTDSSGQYLGGYSTTSSSGGIGIYTGFSPFMGIRVGWGRFAIGYTATMPYHVNIANAASETYLDMDLKFQHSVSLGYRIFNPIKKD